MRAAAFRPSIRSVVSAAIRVVSAAIPLERAVGCVVYCSTVLEAPGVVRHIEGTRLAAGEPRGSVTPRCESFNTAMRAAGLKAPVTKDTRGQVWLKLMGNAVFNPLSALAGATMSEICAFPPACATAARVIAETRDVAAALGHRPRVSVEQRLDGAARVGGHETSMLQDLKAGKTLELAPLVGAVIELADLVGLDVPSLRTLCAATALLEVTDRRDRARDVALARRS